MKTVRSQLAILLAQKHQEQGGKRISLRQVSLATGVREYTLRGFANNTLKEYPAEALTKICNYLGCEVGDLLKLEEIKVE